MLSFLLLAGPAQAQTPRCTKATCTVALQGFSYPVVDGCGEHATPGRIKLILSSTNPAVTPDSFSSANLGLVFTDFDRQAAPKSKPDFGSDLQWRNKDHNSNAWKDFGTHASKPVIPFVKGVLGENIIEVRPKAGTRIWSNRDPNNIQQGPGELVIQTFGPPNGPRFTQQGSAYLMFMGGKGCARVNQGGGTDGTIQ